jgi:two-component system NtrC family sensor kinase
VDPEESQAQSETSQLTAGRLMAEMQAAERALLSRPTISIRFRLVIGFLLCFFLSGAIAITTVVILYQVRFKLQFLETTNAMAYEIQQARRFEKNYFLYGTDLRVARSHVEAAQTLLQTETGNVLEVAGPSNLSALTANLASYAELLSKCEDREGTGTWSAQEKESTEAALRESGSRIIGLAETLTAKERASVDRMIKASQFVPLAFLGILLLLIIYIIQFLARAIILPLRRFQNYTRRIAAGDFSPIIPARPYRDEFSDLALAVNRMMIELKTHEERCIQAAKMGAIGTLTSGIAHELNNPLNNISLTTETLMESYRTLDDEQRWKLLQDIYFETERAGETVKILLDFTRLQKPEMVLLDLGEVIQSTVRIVQNEMTINNICFTCELPPDLPRVLGAANQLRQVFLNLFINGIQAMPRGGDLTVRGHIEDTTRVCIEVHDNGIGIPAEHLDRIFDPFFTTKEPGKGTGLGLSVSQSIIQRHGGDIQATSEQGEGTTIRVYLPYAGVAQA